MSLSRHSYQTTTDSSPNVPVEGHTLHLQNIGFFKNFTNFFELLSPADVTQHYVPFSSTLHGQDTTRCACVREYLYRPCVYHDPESRASELKRSDRNCHCHSIAQYCLDCAIFGCDICGCVEAPFVCFQFRTSGAYCVSCCPRHHACCGAPMSSYHTCFSTCALRHYQARIPYIRFGEQMMLETESMTDRKSGDHSQRFLEPISLFMLSQNRCMDMLTHVAYPSLSGMSRKKSGRLFARKIKPTDIIHLLRDVLEFIHEKKFLPCGAFVHQDGRIAYSPWNTFKRPRAIDYPVNLQQFFVGRLEYLRAVPHACQRHLMLMQLYKSHVISQSSSFVTGTKRLKFTRAQEVDNPPEEIVVQACEECGSVSTSDLYSQSDFTYRLSPLPKCPRRPRGLEPPPVPHGWFRDQRLGPYGRYYHKPKRVTPYPWDERYAVNHTQNCEVCSTSTL